MGSLRPGLFLALLAVGTLNERETRPLYLESIRASAPSVLETDARAMEALEDQGLSLSQLFGARGRNNDDLSQTAAWSTLLITLETDMAQLRARPDLAHLLPRQLFQTSWLRDRRAHFELIGAVNRLDRSFLDPAGCGEARLVYRLVLEPSGRPPTSLPMTVSVVFPQPKGASVLFGAQGCAAIAREWLSLPAGGARRVRALAALYARLPDYTKVEINLQTFHGQGQIFVDLTGYDDNAEYLLRTFERMGDALVPRPLVGTPRRELDEEDKRALAAWIRTNFDAIDAGKWVIPDRFLANRALSVTPRSFARSPNRVFKALFGDGATFAHLPYDRARLVKSPAGLLRRLDQGTCQGCHETRAVAGFHLLGESRTSEANLDAVATPRSAHLDLELGWRAELTAAIARGAAFDEPRPFAERRRTGPGRSGAHCGVNGDPTFAGWTCATGYLCHRFPADDVGACSFATARGVEMGEPCQDVTLGAETLGAGVLIKPRPLFPCSFGEVAGECDLNLLGFPGGLCVSDCSPVGGVARGGELVCGVLPRSGYETECFFTPDEPIEKCIARHLAPRTLKTCSDNRACRDDFACARMIGLPPKMGACVPTYFVYGLRNDGPLLDR